MTQHEPDHEPQSDHGARPGPGTEYETMTAPLISHALQAMLNEHGAQGWELTRVEGETAHLRRPASGDGPAWHYATVPLVPAARQAILDQWLEQGYELVVEHDNVGYFKREA